MAKRKKTIDDKIELASAKVTINQYTALEQIEDGESPEIFNKLRNSALGTLLALEAKKKRESKK